jgi:hypothetical protein
MRDYARVNKNSLSCRHAHIHSVTRGVSLNLPVCLRHMLRPLITVAVVFSSCSPRMWQQQGQQTQGMRHVSHRS